MLRISPLGRLTRHAVVILIAAATLWIGTALRGGAEQGELPESMSTMRVYVGAYTNRGGQGIYMFDFDPATGKAGTPALAVEVDNPSFLDIHPSGNFVYSVGQLPNKRPTEKGPPVLGAVNAYSVDTSNGKLTLINQQPSGGQGPCHVSLDADGRFALVANYPTGNIAVLPIGDDGQLQPATAEDKYTGRSINAQRQTSPHAHSIQIDPSGKFVFVADLGTDKLHVYWFDARRGTLRPNDPPAVKLDGGSGPRHFAFSPNGQQVYVINELLSTVTAFHWNSDAGSLEKIHTVSTLPQGEHVPNNTTAEVLVHPSGKFLYGSNRGHDSIAIFAINPETGRLQPQGHVSSGGKTPRNFRIDPSGRWLLAANQDSNTVVVFRIDPDDGSLSATGETIAVHTPVCLKFYPPGK